LKTRPGGKTPGLATGATRRTGQCDVIIPFNAIHNNTNKQYLEITAISPYCLSGTVMLQIIVKYFDFQITAV